MATWDSKMEGAFKGTNLAVRCYESHPVLKVGKGKLYGGAAFSPVKSDLDVYVVLQKGDMGGRQSDPWEKQARVEVQYSINDMGVPSNVSRFKKMVTWLCSQLQDGKSVHVGCIGGHGRTGTVLSAIVAEALGETDAIQYVRKHYCKRAVESREQVQFLMKHYHVTTVTPTKSGGVLKMTSSKPSDDTHTFDFYPPRGTAKAKEKPRRTLLDGFTKATKTFEPMASSRSLWKGKKK
jgi:hypothetical protein